ncbi:MAG: leucine-rich repeat domain-containing protein [Verrucomicrobia bacterium]|nr:leucine-rich repeat domain-containing protein [Verrucomicrobiota bacterium]
MKQTMIAGTATGGPTRACPLRRAGTGPFGMGVALLVMLAGMGHAQFNCTTNNGTLTITGYTGAGGVVEIPGTIDGLPVTGIGSSAFADNTNLTDVTIADGIASIGWQAFAHSTRLTRVTLPASVTNISGWAFAYCTQLAGIEVDALNPFYRSVDGVLFNHGQTTLIQFPGGRSGGYAIPGAVTTIDNSAFASCAGLTWVTIPDSVRSIGWQGFAYCSGLTNVTLGNSVTNIDSYAFVYCSGLTRVTLPATLLNIGQEGFRSCTGLTGVYFMGNACSVGWGAFAGDEHATVYYLPETTGWGTTFGDRPTAPWMPEVLVRDARFGVRANQFGFAITWASGRIVVVEACTNLTHPAWSPLQTNILGADPLYFGDPEWTNCAARYYRLRAP